jgi:hypothetical protein
MIQDHKGRPCPWMNFVIKQKRKDVSDFPKSFAARLEDNMHHDDPWAGVFGRSWFGWRPLDKLELMDPHLQLALGSVHVLHA